MLESDRQIRVAARALGRAGLVHAYGHCSVRAGADALLVSPAKPLGLVAPGESCIAVPFTGALPGGVLGEVRLHREIYRLRDDIGAIVRCMPPHVVALSAYGEVARPRHGLGAYFYPAPAFWDNPQLVRDDSLAQRAAATLATGRALVMRGNGAITVGATLQEAVVLAWYLEDMARVELLGRAAGLANSPTLTEEAARSRATWSGGIVERMWDFLTSGDPERDEPGHA
jgi:HCOMODA/2-hydroxy-3-carboxy-muconic semialdehyde decarboxylase